MTKNAVKFVFPNLLARQSYGSNEIKNISFVRAPMYLAYNDTETEFMASVPARTSIITKHDNYNRTNVTIFASEMFPQLPDQDGDNQFCAWANDKNGVTSVPRCIVVNIDDENNCLRQFCKNNGTCINLYHREKCRCPFGLKPPDCSRSLSCIDFPCENNATCTNTGKDYVCMCIPGFTGADCEHEVNECASNPCQNNGICLDRRNSFQCICPAIFTGYRCEHDIRMCASDPCLNGASCLNSSSSFNFTCTCHPEYSGRFCEIDVDECPASPCQHGGSCTNLVGDYNCLCVHPYTGKNCENEIDICTMSPCKNGGRCHRQHLSYYCDCTRGWRGTNCTDKVDLCASHPCTNGGSCRDTGDDYLCSCPSGFGVHGSNEPCATTDKASSNQIFVDVNNNLTWPILAAIIGGLLCGVLLMACCCWFLLGRSKKRDDEDPQRDNTPKPQPRWAYARRISVTPFPIPRSSKKDLPALKSNLPAVESSKQTDDLSVSEEVPALDTVADPVTMWPYLKSFNANNSEKLTSDSAGGHPISNRNETPQIFNIYRSSANDPHIHKCGKHIDAEEYFQYM